MSVHIMSVNKTKIFAIICSVIILILDQFTKAFALQDLVYTRPYPIVSVLNEKVNFGLNLFLTYNYGSAFSFVKSATGGTFLLLLVSSVLITCFLFYWLFKESDKNRVAIVSFGLIIGGALGNIYDRISLGYVIDFIDVYAGRWHWPVFNVADMAISVGVILLLWQILFGHYHTDD